MRYPPIAPVLHHGPCRSIDISEDSTLLATAVNVRNAVQVWDLRTGAAVSEPLPHPGGFYGLFTVALSPDGQSVLTGGTDGELRLWDWRTGTLRIPAMKHGDEVYSATFTADGRYGVSVCRDRRIRVWDLSDARLIAAPIDVQLMSASFIHGSPRSGYRFAFGNMDNQCFVADLSSLFESQSSVPDLDRIVLQSELISSSRIHLGDVSRLTNSEWLERLKKFANP